ncbi:hypothetical protein MBT42_39395 [Streptomyces sp. MBT42]|uniref:hypothetical protein n=1 Tax=Streptomyces sp. MBT42 TaxID=1488373 RepID=UPI001E60397B|nr:hypothetical protein [Streptomyces sp. MBT42]MCD2469577.1 hypothetical protein [Streptomyces sp. MBT42]
MLGPVEEVVLTVRLEVAREKIEEAVLESDCRAVKMVPREILEATFEDLDETVAVGLGSASALSMIYRDRYDSIKEFREENFGWCQFFAALEKVKDLVGTFALRGGGWWILILVNESGNSVIGALVRPPSPADWPEGASGT